MKKYLLIPVGTFILAFGLYNIHAQCDITEGGVLGAILLIHHWTNISPAISGLILDSICYFFGYLTFGFDFIKKAIISTISFSIFYGIFELFPPIFTNIYNYPLLCAILGGTFVGIGVGIIVKSKGAAGGDDALAMVIAKKLEIKIPYAYLFTDLSVLLLSLSYIPLSRIMYSLVTVTISSLLIEKISQFNEE
ncbi:MAG: YitT family protein [Erysipelotrichaceae bacterium]